MLSAEPGQLGQLCILNQRNNVALSLPVLSSEATGVLTQDALGEMASDTHRRSRPQEG